MSKSSVYSQQKAELKAKESLLLEDLNTGGEKAKRIALWGLGVGLIALIGYGIYRGFSDKPKKEKKERKENTKATKKKLPKEDLLVDQAIQNLAPSIGKWILKEFKN